VGKVSYFHIKQLPVLRPDRYIESDLSFIVPRIVELTYTAHDMAPWAQALGFEGSPFAFDPNRRAMLRVELDACYARLYGQTRDELRYILDLPDVANADYPTRPSGCSRPANSASSTSTVPAGWCWKPGIDNRPT
jgi:hypothetical protein